MVIVLVSYKSKKDGNSVLNLLIISKEKRRESASLTMLKLTTNSFFSIFWRNKRKKHYM